jgi:hypothetical protein
MAGDDIKQIVEFVQNMETDDIQKEALLLYLEIAGIKLDDGILPETKSRQTTINFSQAFQRLIGFVLVILSLIGILYWLGIL